MSSVHTIVDLVGGGRLIFFHPFPLLVLLGYLHGELESMVVEAIKLKSVLISSNEASLGTLF